MKNANIFIHQGLGDHIECSGLIREICKKYAYVNIPVKQRYEKNVYFLYRDNPCVKIHVMPESCDNSYADELNFFNGMKSDSCDDLYIGHHLYFNNKEISDLPVAKAFYHIAKIPYIKKFENFYFERDYENENKVYDKLNPDNKQYIFVHDDESRGFTIKIDTNYKIIRNDSSENIFHMLKIIENAEQIHCMSSSLLGMIDCAAASPLLKTKINNIPKFLHWNVRRVDLGKDPCSYFGSKNFHILY